MDPLRLLAVGNLEAQFRCASDGIALLALFGKKKRAFLRGLSEFLCINRNNCAKYSVWVRSDL
jgi:hypothetical protein